MITNVYLNNFRDLTKFEDGIGEKVSLFINFVVTFIALLILALVRGWELALICLIALPVTMLSLGIVVLVSTLTGFCVSKIN